MNEQKSKLANAMLELEKELRVNGLWHDGKPTQEQLVSGEPFSCDVMDLQQWLQWIFLPRMKAIIVSDAPLPASCSIAPYAEESIAKPVQETSNIINIVKEIDKVISERN